MVVCTGIESPGNTDGESPDANSPGNTDGESPDGNSPGNTDGESPDADSRVNTDGESPDANSPGDTDGNSPGNTTNGETSGGEHGSHEDGNGDGEKDIKEGEKDKDDEKDTSSEESQEDTGTVAAFETSCFCDTWCYYIPKSLNILSPLEIALEIAIGTKNNHMFIRMFRGAGRCFKIIASVCKNESSESKEKSSSDSDVAMEKEGDSGKSDTDGSESSLNITSEKEGRFAKRLKRDEVKKSPVTGEKSPGKSPPRSPKLLAVKVDNRRNHQRRTDSNENKKFRLRKVPPALAYLKLSCADSKQTLLFDAVHRPDANEAWLVCAALIRATQNCSNWVNAIDGALKQTAL